MDEKAKFIWLDGKLIDWDQAQIHVLTHTLHYGLGVFEGIRCYKCQDKRSAVFRLKDHIRRLFDSAQAMMLEIPFSKDEIYQAVIETLKTNGQKEAYIRPIVFIGDGTMGLYPGENPIRVSIITWGWESYLGKEGLKQGIRAKISSFTRHHVNIMMTKTKTCGNYVNSILAKLEVVKAGYDEAIMLDTEGYVCEATGENIFIIRDKVLKTPPLTSVLPGITRDSIITLAQDLGYKVEEKRFTRDELYIADEAFFSGTAAEVTPIREVDDRQIGEGKPGPITQKIQKLYFDVVKGKIEKYHYWLDFIT
ncbi:branched-chain amino acid aminotransferase [Candidatus Desulfofervidus auxilii]|uniref:Branched-chain-amino-acid aminotransferase n=1 Tax=Desulfofervidus auxilii TaxID=1621989 RepID=A0A7U4TID0_DESA2|nr:branched-chain amino acid transaminase [Candidatus Desulfofervidus auxilii]AMM41133.1 branched-chain amino acid aminotransferase [Candidatus Desulfofervidus auxilii]